MRTYYLDTNILIRYLVGDVPKQAKIVDDYLDKAQKKQIRLFVPKVAIWESYYVLLSLYKKTRNEVVEALLSVTNTDYLEVESRGDMAGSLQLSKKENVSLIDSICLNDSRSLNYELLTFDKKLLTMAKKN